MIDQIYIIVTFVLFIVGTASIIYTMGRVRPWRKPLYWIGLIINLTFLLLYGLALFDIASGPTAGQVVGIGLRVGLFLVALSTILIPYVDRLEMKTMKKMDDIVREALKGSEQ